MRWLFRHKKKYKQTLIKRWASLGLRPSIAHQEPLCLNGWATKTSPSTVGKRRPTPSRPTSSYPRRAPFRHGPLNALTARLGSESRLYADGLNRGPIVTRKHYTSLSESDLASMIDGHLEGQQVPYGNHMGRPTERTTDPRSRCYGPGGVRVLWVAFWWLPAESIVPVAVVVVVARSVNLNVPRLTEMSLICKWEGRMCAALHLPYGRQKKNHRYGIFPSLSLCVLLCHSVFFSVCLCLCVTLINHRQVLHAENISLPFIFTLYECRTIWGLYAI